MTLRHRAGDATPKWLYRYNISGKARVMHLGSYARVSLADARKTVKELRARVVLGFDPAGEKQERKREAVAKIEAARTAVTVGALADEYVAERILGRWKHPHIVRSRTGRDIKPAIGNKSLDDVRPTDVDALLKAIIKRGAPTMATAVLRWLKRMFDYAIKREMMTTNPAAAFDPSDAGGTEKPRERWLTRDELALPFNAMRTASGWAYENTLAVKLLLMLAVRKTELIGARLNEFDLDAAVWRLPAERTKTDAAMDIPLPTQAVACVRDLERLARMSGYLFPAHVAMMPGKRRRLDKNKEADALTDQLERTKARIRSRVEHPLRTVKRQFRHVKMGHRGLARNTAQLHTLFALANLWLVRKRILQAAAG